MSDNNIDSERSLLAEGPAVSSTYASALGKVQHRRLRLFLSSPAAILGATIVMCLILVALVGPVLAPHDPEAQSLMNRFALPFTSDHLLGTDELGRDVLTRLIYGARVSLFASLLATLIGAGVGVPLGALAGYHGGRFDGGLSFISDAIMSAPGIILALAVVGVLGPGLTNGMIAIGLIFTPRFFRVSRAATQDVKAETFIRAGIALGATSWRTLWRHILPNMASAVIVQITIALGVAITAEASLSFLGLGVQVPDPSWGSMLTKGTSNLRREPLLVYLPGACIAISVLGWMLVGDGLRRTLGTDRAVLDKNRIGRESEGL